MAHTIYVDNHPGWPGEIIVEHAIERVESISPRPDPSWTYTDAAGHFHAYDQAGSDPWGRYPTLVGKTEHVCCDGVHYSDGSIEECAGYDVTRHYCRICEEEIKPGMMAGPHVDVVPGRESWRVEVYVPAECLQEIANKEVTIRAEHRGETVFGVARSFDRITLSSSAGAVVELDGVSPLGRRR